MTVTMKEWMQENCDMQSTATGVTIYILYGTKIRKALNKLLPTIKYLSLIQSPSFHIYFSVAAASKNSANNTGRPRISFHIAYQQKYLDWPSTLVVSTFLTYISNFSCTDLWVYNKYLCPSPNTGISDWMSHANLRTLTYTTELSVSQLW